jgi:hypothetical protein
MFIIEDERSRCMNLDCGCRTSGSHIYRLCHVQDSENALDVSETRADIPMNVCNNFCVGSMYAHKVH